jgi:hypothetical protein
MMTDGPTTESAAFENLDLSCAKAGQEMVEIEMDLEKTITDALAVLEEQGVYAMFLYLKAKGKNEGGHIQRKLFDFLKTTPKNNPLIPEGEDSNVLDAVQKYWAEDLDRLLFARDLIRQTLVYARYHAKARKGGEEPPEDAL